MMQVVCECGREKPCVRTDEPCKFPNALNQPITEAAPQWRTIDSAPKDGTEFIGKSGRLVFLTHWQQYYDKWPHDEGGPTFRGGWSYEQRDAHIPFNPTHWLPLPPAPPGEK